MSELQDYLTAIVLAIEEFFLWIYMDHAWVLIIFAAFLGWLLG